MLVGIVVHSRFTLTRCRMKVLLCKKIFAKKKKIPILYFGGGAVSNSDSTNASIDIPSTIGNTQNYLVSLHIG